MRRVLRGIDAVSDWSGKSLSVLVLVLMVLLVVEITLRYVFNSPTIWAHETSQHLFGVYSVLAGAYLLLHSEHVRMDLVYGRFSPRRKAIIDSITYLVFFLFCGLMLAGGLQVSEHAVRIMEKSFTPWAPPLYPLKCTVPLGALLIIIQGIANYIRVIHMAITGRELA